MLALAQPAEAKIIYIKTHHIIGPGQHYHLDLNHDGRSDFRFRDFTRCGTDTCRTLLTATRAAIGNGIVGYNSIDGIRWASALRKGKLIGNAGHFYPQRYIGSLITGSLLRPGPWYDTGNRYLGLKFQIHGQTHYAWARLRIKVTQGYPTGSIVGTLTGYAYETIPNKPIIAGKITGPDVIALEPGSLGRLALGRK
jgi:hypothetical protein